MTTQTNKKRKRCLDRGWRLSNTTTNNPNAGQSNTTYQVKEDQGQQVSLEPAKQSQTKKQPKNKTTKKTNQTKQTNRAKTKKESKKKRKKEKKKACQDETRVVTVSSRLLSTNPPRSPSHHAKRNSATVNPSRHVFQEKNTTPTILCGCILCFCVRVFLFCVCGNSFLLFHTFQKRKVKLLQLVLLQPKFC